MFIKSKEDFIMSVNLPNRDISSAIDLFFKNYNQAPSNEQKKTKALLETAWSQKVPPKKLDNKITCLKPITELYNNETTPQEELEHFHIEILSKIKEVFDDRNRLAHLPPELLEGIDKHLSPEDSILLARAFPSGAPELKNRFKKIHITTKKGVQDLEPILKKFGKAVETIIIDIDGTDPKSAENLTNLLKMLYSHSGTPTTPNLKVLQIKGGIEYWQLQEIVKHEKLFNELNLAACKVLGSYDVGAAYLIARHRGDVNVTEALIRLGADLDEDGRTTLYNAVLSNDLELVQTLIQRGANVNKADNEGRTPLHVAVINRRLDIVQTLLATEGVDINKGDNRGWTPLHYAANNGKLDVVKALLATEGIDVNKTNKRGKTAFDETSDADKQILAEWFYPNSRSR